MYVITGASGNTGKVIADKLLKAGKKVRVIGRSADKLKELIAQGAEPTIGNLEDTSFLERAFKGASAVYAMIPPNSQAQNFRVYQNSVADVLIEAIKRAEVQYVVALSSVGAHLKEKAGVVQGLHDMEQKFNPVKGVHFLILRPSYFMENLFGQIDVIKHRGVMGSPLKADLRFPIVASRDIADVSARHLLSLDFAGSKVLYVLGPRDVTFNEIASVLGKAIGKPDLKYVQIPSQDAKQSMIQNWRLTENLADALIEFNESMNEGRIFNVITRTPESTTPTSLEEFAYSFAQVYKQ